MDRRSFVQFCVGAAAAGAVAAGTLSMARPLVIPRLGSSVSVRYFGAHRTAGPAPRGVPYIPIRLTAEGVFEGVPVVQGPDGSEINVLEWYKYCGHSSAPGLRLEADQDNTLKYFISEEKAAAIKPWYEDLLEQPVKPDDFPDVEFGAGFAWRSEGQSGANVLSGAIIRYKAKALRHLEAGLVNPAKPVSQAEYEFIRDQFFVTVEDSVFAAVSTFCTHFCCIPGYKEAEKLARPRNAWDKLFCTCHNSVYEPREPTVYSFFPEPAKEEEGGGSGGAAAGGGGGH